MTDLIKMTESEAERYGDNKVFFEEKKKELKNGEKKVVLYTNIICGNDRNTHYCQPTKERKVITPEKEVIFRDEKDLYKRAYDRFLAKKEALKPTPKKRVKVENKPIVEALNIETVIENKE